jgi:short-subunit dehydrogenase
VIVAENARPAIDGGTVLVTGASAGIGRELAVQLAPRAKALILLARRATRLEELRTGLLARHPQLRVLALPVDLSDENDVNRAMAEADEQAGAVDVLVNNAAARVLSRRQAARSATRLRSTAKGAANAPDRPEGQVRS